MDDYRGLIAFTIIFLLLAAAGIGLGNADTITPVVAEAQAGAAIGSNTVMALEKGASIFLKLIVGATVTGIAAAVFTEARKAYKLWKRSANTRRWVSGPNANYQKEPQMPKIRKEDLMFMALLDKSPLGAGLGLRQRTRRPVAQSDDGDELDIQL